ncbi:hypothetical protein MRB53_041158 [Persea americana]|nr:hypothetical protein MRB53_041158 [Persea americana]
MRSVLCLVPSASPTTRLRPVTFSNCCCQRLDDHELHSCAHTAVFTPIPRHKPQITSQSRLAIPSQFSASSAFEVLSIYSHTYADLDLPTTASIDDIRKQYRKLAFQFHPDRNSGREEECVPKFQAIQAANEILSDPNQKLLYDGDRGRAGGGSGVRGHPYQANSNFPPPPRRTQPGVYQRPAPTAQRPQPNGADRFSNFASQAPPPRRAEPAQDRSNMFKAWNNMNNNAPKPAPPPRNTVPPSPGAQPQRRPQAPPRADTQYPNEEKIRASYQYREATSPQYDSEGADSKRAAWEAFKNAQTAKSPGVRRSNTSRTPKRAGFDPNAPGSDERPATGSYYSHRHRSEDLGQPADREPKAAPPRRPNINPTDPHNLHARFADDGEDDVPYSEGERKRTPYSSFIGEKTDFSSNMRKSKSTVDSTKLKTDNFRTRSTSPNSKSAHTTPINPSRKGASFDLPTTDSEPESAGTGPGDADSNSSYESPFAKPPKLSKAPKDRPKLNPSPPSRKYNGAQGPFSPPLPNDPSAGEKKDNIFNLANGIPPFTPPSMPTGKSRSEENINTKFSGDWNGEFSGAPTNVKPKQPARKANGKGRAGNRSTATFGQPSPLGVHAFQDLPPPPPGPPPNHAPTPTDTPTNEFAKDQWEQALKNGWFQPPSRAQTMDDKQSPTAQPESGADTPDRMDVDEDIPAYNSMPPPPKPVRPTNAPQQQYQANTAHVRSASNMATAQANQAGLNTNLDDLSHVEPFARPADAGLGNLNDMAANLPFRSQAAHILSFQQDKPQKLAMPSVPMEPTPPDQLTKATWMKYVMEFKKYLQFFDYFDDQFFDHFKTRQQLSRKLMSNLSWVDAVGDVTNTESPNVPTGYMAYARATEEDAMVREVWNVGHVRHLSAVRAFGAVRDKVKAMTEAGTLNER